MKRVSTFLGIIFILFSLIVSGCKGSGDAAFQVIFFDIENSSDGSVHYDGVNNDRTFGYQGVKPADCYMIKTGDTEILVDSGYQLQGSGIDSGRLAKIYRENVIKKIERYCTDGVLEYLIVTHGDYDHLVGLAVDGGVLDYFKSEGKKIEKIIDFDSDLAVYLSNPNGNDIFPGGQNLLLNSTVINDYRTKRDFLVNEKNTIHIPAAAFFKGTDYLEENTLVNAMLTEYLDKYFRLDKNGKLTNDINSSLITNFYYFSNEVIIHKKCDGETKLPEYDNLKFKSTYNAKIDFGSLQSANDRYYYSIPLNNGVELRMLYNWCYDHFYRHSFDAKDRNNISVCFEIVSGNCEFLSFGDLGMGESGIVRYYKDSGMLNDIECFKASHHGSTTNGENSKELFELIKAKNVIVPGVAQINRDILSSSNMISDPIYSGLSGVAVMKDAFFSNVKAGNTNCKIYCTQIAQLVNDKGFQFISAPFYGDIVFSVSIGKCSVDCTYKGTVEGYVVGTSDGTKHYKFSNIKNGELLSFTQTDYYKIIYENKGNI